MSYTSPTRARHALSTLPKHVPYSFQISLPFSSQEDWLSLEESSDVKLIEDLTSQDDTEVVGAGEGAGGGAQGSGGGEGEKGEGAQGQVLTPDPLRQLITALSRSAESQAEDDPLYLSYANIMGKVRPEAQLEVYEFYRR